MNKGYLLLVLHAHLPYIRHPEHEYFLEENWLYEAITESYLPLLDVLDGLLNDNIDFRITFSLSPTLIEMFNDPLLRDRCSRYINNLIQLSEKEISRTEGDPSFAPLAKMYCERFKRIRFLYEESFNKDLTSAFRKLQETGKVEIITTAATHAFLPMLSMYPRAVKAQIKVAAENYKKNFGKTPNGIWLPECGYYPDLDVIIKKAGLKFFFLEAHGILNGVPKPRYGIHRPVTCPSGVIAFGRDTDSSKQVWSSIEGYPGDFDYRDFYRDIGFDLPDDYIRPHIHPDGIRTYTGIKYHRVTGKDDSKMPYIREHALKKAEEHARNFLLTRKKQIQTLNKKSVTAPVITAPYDAELFGHWWFEGPEWLGFLIGQISSQQRQLKTIIPTQYIKDNSGFQRITPSMSSWGQRGYNEVWLNSSNSWIYRHVHKIAEKMIELSDIFPHAEGLTKRALDQAARETLLLQHSDWAFIIRAGTASEYASKRIVEHAENFNWLYDSIKTKNINESSLSVIEDKNKVFTEMDYRVYSDQDRSLSKG